MLNFIIYFWVNICFQMGFDVAGIMQTKNKNKQLDG